MQGAQPDTPLNLLLVTSEASPLAQTGGLGQVCGSLPPALAKLGLQVTVVMPLYRSIDRKAHNLRSTNLRLIVPLAGWKIASRVWRGDLDGCPVYLLANEDLYNRAGLYGGAQGDYPDNVLRFTFLCRGAVELARALGQPVDLVHVHDWQTGLLPAYLATRPFDLGPLEGAASLLTIHNLAFQGRFRRDLFRVTGLPDSFDNLAGAELWGDFSFLKAGLVSTDALSTVSPSYAQEIQTPDGGMGLDGLLRARRDDLFGILNGVDYGVWSPEQDPHLPAAYSAADLSGRPLCRQALLEAFGLLPAPARKPVLGFVGRLTEQKGVSLMLGAAPALLARGLRLLVLGTGEPWFEQALSDLARSYPDQVGLKLAYSEPLAHLMHAGCDIMLMPSSFEPCGLNQMYAMRYGAAPLVHATGGLRDTVTPFHPANGQGTGFVFALYAVEPMLDALEQALAVWAQPAQWRQLMANAMAQDFSWEVSAKAYAALYRRLVQRKRG
ncbi:MAG: glycogen synthase GlgA [Thermodesulfobacteriota bacterium]